MTLRMRWCALSCALLVTAFVSASVVYGADMFSGTWKLNVAKSKYSPGPAPKSGVTKIAAVEGGIKVTADGENAEGKKTHTEYTVKFDGKDYPDKILLDGKVDPAGADMISAKKIDDYAYETTSKQKGKVLTTQHVVFSRDGKTRTITGTGKDTQGRTVNNTSVYEK